MIIPDFTDFLNIAGSIGSAMIAFILPPLIYMRVFKDELSMSVKVINILIICLGVGGGGYSILYSIDKLANGDTS